MSTSSRTDFPARLAEAIELSGLSKSQLAKRIGKSPAAVTGWLSGDKTPTATSLAAIAKALGADVGWLREGRGAGPAGDDSKLRESYEAACQWGFREAPEDGGRDYGNANVWAFDPTIAVMTRDILQNCRDAKLPGNTAVDVSFKVIRLKGNDLENFKQAIAWNALDEHLRASSRVDQRLGRLIKHNLELLETTEEMLLLAVEDKGTIGLIGEETGHGNFAALVRNNLDSNKQEPTSGGCFGLGKAVLWRMSSFSTVLFGSHLSKPTADGHSRFRMMGKCDLTWHECEAGKGESQEYAGPGWYGKRDGEFTVSCWDNPTLLEDLYLGREDKSGTTALIVGFHDPSSSEPRTAADLAKDIRAAVADWFWPDLALGRMHVNVEVCEGNRRISGGEVVADEYREEFVDAITKWRNDELVEKFVKGGDVVCTTVKLDYPKRRSDPKHPAGEHDATLLVRYAGEGPQTSDSRLYELAMFRGVGMVVKYMPLRHVRIGALPFHAVLLCGNASVRPDIQPTSECKEADRFLRTAEPPSHNDWTSTPDLSAEYMRPTKKAIDDFLAEVRKAVGEIVRPSTEELDDGPNAIKELLTIGEEDQPPERPKIYRPDAVLNSDGSWQITAKVHVKPRDHRWKMKPVLLFDVESGSRLSTRWQSLVAVKRCVIDDEGNLIMDAGAREAEFEAVTDPESHPVDSREACVVIDVHNCTRLMEDE